MSWCGPGGGASEEMLSTSSLFPVRAATPPLTLPRRPLLSHVPPRTFVQAANDQQSSIASIPRRHGAGVQASPPFSAALFPTSSRLPVRAAARRRPRPRPRRPRMVRQWRHAPPRHPSPLYLNHPYNNTLYLYHPYNNTLYLHHPYNSTLCLYHPYDKTLCSHAERAPASHPAPMTSASPPAPRRC